MPMPMLNACQKKTKTKIGKKKMSGRLKLERPLAVFDIESISPISNSRVIKDDPP